MHGRGHCHSVCVWCGVVCVCVVCGVWCGVLCCAVLCVCMRGFVYVRERPLKVVM